MLAESPEVPELPGLAELPDPSELPESPESPESRESPKHLGGNEKVLQFRVLTVTWSVVDFLNFHPCP